MMKLALVIASVCAVGLTAVAKEKKDRKIAQNGVDTYNCATADGSNKFQMSLQAQVKNEMVAGDRDTASVDVAGKSYFLRSYHLNVRKTISPNPVMHAWLDGESFVMTGFMTTPGQWLGYAKAKNSNQWSPATCNLAN